MTARPFDPGRALYLAVNGGVIAFLLLPIVIVGVFALNPTPYIAFPPACAPGIPASAGYSGLRRRGPDSSKASARAAG